MYLLYSLLLAAGILLSLPWWFFQMLRHGKYRAGLWERFGKVAVRLAGARSEPKAVIWIHAVSVGEVLAVSGLVDALQKRVPSHRVVISTTTDTGQALARKKLGPENVFYFPMDFAFAIRPYLQALRPQLVILAETEFWPNFLRLTRASGAAIAVVNARISDRSWPNYRRFRWALRRMLRAIDLFLAQTDEDANRLRSVGALQDRIQVTGNLKFDLTLPAQPPILDRLRKCFAQDTTSPVLVCGSTVDGEETLLLRAFENVLASHPRAAMILAPRHPERFDAVAKLLQEMAVPYVRRSQWNDEPLAGRVLLLDTIGELAALYALADIAFVGGSLVPRGGHNIIEPAQYGVPIVVGQHTENFRDMVALFQRREAVRIVGPAELSPAFLALLANDHERRQLGHRAQETMLSQTGATSRTLDALAGLLPSAPNTAGSESTPALSTPARNL
jgi:3-deoxy-D-manno-octulosonic-acid transferase